MILQVCEPPSCTPRDLAINPDLSTIAAAIRALSWDDITFVVLRLDENTWIEGSGSLRPEDGLSARFMEDGVEHVSRSAPEGLNVIEQLLTSFLLRDDRWRTLIEWD